MREYIKTAYTKSPLIVFTICAVLLGASVGATMYWSSINTYQIDFSVGGDITAKIVDPAVVADNWPTTLAEFNALPELADFLDEGIEGKHVLYLMIWDTNTDNLYLSGTATIPGSVSLTCVPKYWTITRVGALVKQDGIFDDLTIFDGSQCVNLRQNDHPLWMVTKDFAVQPTGAFVRMLRLSFSHTGGIVGSNRVSEITILLGDSL